MKSIGVIMPVLNQQQLTYNILYRMSLNTILPKEVIVIDNASTENIKAVCDKFKRKLNIIYAGMGNNIGVNAAWQFGFDWGFAYDRPDYYAVLNNDLVLNHRFFEKIMKAFEKKPDAGIMCPRNVKKATQVNDEDDPSAVKLTPMKGREGWAFIIKNELIRKIDPIPGQFKFFCGDDYLFYMCRKMGYGVYKMSNNIIHHRKNSTLKVEMPNWKGNELKKEKALYRKWVKEQEK